MLDIYRHFLGLRVRWYARASIRLVLRHWQWFLIAGLVVPGEPIVAVPRLLFPAIIYAWSRGGDVLSHAAVLAGVQLAAFVWVLPQRRNLSGGDFAAYSATLPISSTVRRSVDATLVLIVDSPVIIVIVSALCSAPGNGGVFEICAVVTFVSALLVMQVASLAGACAWLAAVAVLAALAADLLLAFGLTSREGVLAWPALLAAAVVVIAPALVPSSLRDSTDTVAQPVSTSSAAGVLRAGTLSPVLVVQAKALAARPIVTGMRLAAALVLALGTDRLIGVFGFDGRAVPTAIAAMALAALVLSGLFRTLREAHAPMRGYLATLPLGTHFWPVRDVVLVMALGSVPFAILVLPLVAHGLCPGPSLAVLTLAYGVLIVLLRMVLALRRELTVLLATMLAVGWTGAAISAIVP